MDNFRKPTAVFFTIAFVITAVMTIFFFNFDRKAFSAETYQRAFAREDFYNKIPGLMAQAIVSSNTDTSQFPLMMQSMSFESWEGFIRALLPPEMLRLMGDDVLNSTFAYLNLQSDSVQINLMPVKTSMTSETGTQAVFSLLTSLPDCTFDQIALTTFNLLSGGQIELCNPPADMLIVLTPVVQGQMQLTASTIPDQLTLVTAPPYNDPRERLQSIRLLMRLSLVLPILFLLGVTILVVRSLNDWLFWWGIPFAATGFSAFVAGILGAPLIGVVLERLLANRLPGFLPAFLLDFTGDFAAAMARALLTPVVWQGLVLTVIGTAMAGIGYYLKYKHA